MQQWLGIGIVLACTAMTARAQTTPAAESAAVTEPAIHIEDVDRFYEVYDAAGGLPTADQLQHDYIDPGSEGLHVLAKLRNVTGARILETLMKNPGLYVGARRCMAVLPRVRERVAVALRALIQMYPQARLPPVTIAVGRGKPIGVGSPATGVQIGLEALCATSYFNPNVEDRFVYVIAHEYAHVQQVPAIVDGENLTVLEGSLMEGVAELVAELTVGKDAVMRFTSLTQGREKEIETAFVADQDKKDLSAWLYNGTMQKPGDMGYWVGYRIAKTYYHRASDKRQALRELLEMTDAKAVLVKSGWYPGIELK